VGNFLKTLVEIIVLGYLGISFYLFFFQHRFVYYPDPKILHTPKDIDLPFEAVRFQTSDGVSLSGWYIPHPNAKGTILFCHGNAGNIGTRLGTIAKSHYFGYNFFIFDYRGFGESEGKLSEKGTYLDAEAAWDYLIKERNAEPEKIIIYGRSLGAAIASWLAKEKNPKVVLLECPFQSIKEIGADVYPYLPVRFLSRFNYNTKEYVQQINCPVLVMHSPEDMTIPFHHGKAVFAAAKEPKVFLELAGDHANGFLVSGNIYDKGVKEFLSNHY